MNTGIIIPLGDGDKLRGYSSGSRLAPTAAPRMPLSVFDREVDRLVAGGYLPFLRPCLPPGVSFTTWDRTAKQTVENISDGKVPGELVNGAWRAMADWPNRMPTDADVALWRSWPGAGVCLATGAVAALDVDIKIDASDTGSEANRGRALVEAIKSLTAQALGVTVDRLPMRWRENSTSCMILARLLVPLGKRILRLKDDATGRLCAVEFLGRGQQIVIAGMHTSGAPVKSALPELQLEALPVLESAKLDALIPAIAEAAALLGFSLASLKGSGAGREQTPPYSPAAAVLREVMRRRAEWVPSVVPCVAISDREWRITSADLDRDLDEDLAIFPDGIHDFGTERTHTPISFIREFGTVAADGNINVGGAPDYGPAEGQPYAVVGERDLSVRRPNEAEALTWLCRTLAGDRFPAFEAGATWASSLALVARAVGLDWASMESAHHFEFARGDGPEYWQPSEMCENANFLVALRAVDPEAFDKIEFAHDMRLDAIDLRKTLNDAQASLTASLRPPEAQAADLVDWPEPVDIFGHDSVGDLSTLPQNCMPPLLERWVKSEARRKGVPEMFAAAAAFGAASSAVGASLRIRARKFDDTFVQPAGLWITLVAEPGSAKSPTINAAWKPLRDLDSESYARSRPAVEAWDLAKRNNRKGAPAIGPRPPIKRFTVDDATLEEQLYIHRDNPRGIGRIPDELTGLLGALGEYKKGADGDRSKMLRFFDGNGITVDRRSAGSLRADSTLMAVTASSQPAKMREITRELGVDGMLQRFIMVLDDGVERQQHDEYPDRDAASAYTAAIRRLALAEYPYCPPLKMSEAGHDALAAALKQIRHLRFALGQSDAWKGHVEKWGLFLPRIILTMHALEVAYSGANVDPENEIEAGTVERSVMVARLLLRHSLRFYSDYLAPNATATEARWIAGYLLTHPDLETVKRKTISDARKDLRSDRRTLLGAMGELESLGWCAVHQRDGDGPTMWRINPRVHIRFAEQALREKEERLRKREAIVRAGEGRKWVSGDNMSEEGAAR